MVYYVILHYAQDTGPTPEVTRESLRIVTVIVVTVIVVTVVVIVAVVVVITLLLT